MQAYVKKNNFHKINHKDSGFQSQDLLCRPLRMVGNLFKTVEPFNIWYRHMQVLYTYILWNGAYSADSTEVSLVKKRELAC